MMASNSFVVGGEQEGSIGKELKIFNIVRHSQS